MKAGYAALIPLIKGATELPLADCFTITLRNGDVFRYTALDVPVWLNGQYFAANAVRIEGMKLKQSVGVNIDEQSITLIYSPDDLIYGLPWGQAIRQRVLDGAYIQRDRAFFDPSSNWPPKPISGAIAAGGVTLFKGRVTTVSGFGRTTASISVKSNLVLLDIDFPRNLWQAACMHTLYDTECGLNRAAYQTIGAVLAGATYTTVPTSMGGSGATFQVTMSGTAGAPIQNVVLTSSAAVNAGYQAMPTLTLTDPTGTGAVLKPLVYGTTVWDSGGFQLRGISVISGGENYTNPTLVISAGSAGTATAEVRLAAGSMSVASVKVLNGGSNYGNATQLVFNGGSGVNAAAVPVVSGGVITGVTLVNGGSGFSSTPTLEPSDDLFINYSQGSLMFQGGQNAGTLLQLKNAMGGVLTMAQPLDYVPAVGDQFVIWPGCDHTRGAGGCAKFNNLPNFRGFPNVPPPQTAY